MINQLSGLGYGIITFAIIIGVGTVVLSRFDSAVASCSAEGYNLNNSFGIVNGYNETLGLCQNDTGAYTNTSSAGQASANTHYMNTQLGSTGLAGWTPAVIAFIIGMLFLGGMMIDRNSSKKV